MKRNIFKDKVVIVTGASSGIGKATALEFARNGSRVVIAARSAEKLAHLEKEITAMGAEALSCVTDVPLRRLPENGRGNSHEIRYCGYPHQ